MSDWTDARETAALAALATAIGDNDDDPVTAAQFAEAMWPSTVGAGMEERSAAIRQARLVLGPMIGAATVTETGAATDETVMLYGLP